MRDIKTINEYYGWTATACVDGISCARIGKHDVTVSVIEVWDEGYDRCDYGYSFTMDGAECDECEIIDLVKNIYRKPAARKSITIDPRQLRFA